MRTAVATVPRDALATPPAAAAAPARPRLVVVGNGMVGHRLCRRLVALGGAERYDLVVFGEEARPAYDRVHLTDALVRHSEDDLLLAPASWYARQRIDLRLGDPIVDIDRQRRVVRSAAGHEVAYSRLVLATGSSPYVPPIEGAETAGVFLYRTIADLQAIRRRAREARTAAVVGGGLLGLEAARALQRLGLAVTVIEAAASLMPAQLDDLAGRNLLRRIAALGIAVRTGTVTRRIEVQGERRTLHFAGEESLSADVVVIAAGVRPRSQLAARCGLARCQANGVVVDDYLRTCDPDIYAIGECASHRLQVYGLVAPGYEMAEALAQTLSGTPTPFRGVVPATKLKLLGVEVTTAGEPLDRGVAVRFSDADAYRLIRIERGRLTGALGIGDWPEFSRLQDAIARRARIWPWQAARFGRRGTVWTVSTELPVTEWPAQAVVCNCLNVTRGQIAAVCGSRSLPLDALVESTGASTVCGTCRPLVAQLAAAGPIPTPQVATGLLAVSLAALVIAVALLAAPAYPFAGSMGHMSWLELLWRDATARQISGFLLLASTAMASLLGLRRRWPRAAAFGTYATWRGMHAAIGLLTLLALAVHTGGRLGENLNLALMASFATLNVLGAAAGAMTAASPRATPWRRWRAVAVGAHLLATWPLPILVAFHVLSVYYF